jgi:hypothetical protein
MKPFTTLIWLLLSGVVFSQKTVDVKLNLRDGNSISGTTSMTDLVLKTNYGQLTVPIQNVRTIVVGLGKDKAIGDKALQNLKILNANGSEETRKGAYQDLVKLGVKAIAAINDFQNDPKNNQETEVAGEYTIDNALTEIKNTFNIDDASRVNDVITIDNEYTMGGIYEFTKLDVKTEYGNLSIPKEKIKSMDVSYAEASNGNEVVLKLMAGKHISGNQQGGWLKTGIVLKQGQKFTINASGEVTLASLSDQKYKPDGSYVAAGGASYPAAVPAEDYGTGSSYPVYGNVVYKIGEASYETLRAGAKYTGTAITSGMLLISIYETVYNAANTGSYTVKVSVK